MNRLRKRLIKQSVQVLLHASAFIARRPHLEKIGNLVFGKLADLKSRHAPTLSSNNLVELGKYWQSAFPSAKQVPITRHAKDTVYAQITTPCPLRGSGDVEACYRMMEYDRAYARKVDADFVVIRSQAEPGVEVCEVALQFKREAINTTLIHAHQRQKGQSIIASDAS